MYVNQQVQKLIEKVIGDECVTKKLTDDDWLGVNRIAVESAKCLMESDSTQASIYLPKEFLEAVREHGGDFEKSAAKVEGVKYRPRKGSLTVDEKVLARCYTESLGKITSQLQHLLDTVAGVECLLVIGGYSESHILYNHLREKFEGRSLRVFRPKNASTAVLKGALMFGQNPKAIVTRVSAYTYGIKMNRVFDPSKHAGKETEMYDGEKYCTEVFDAVVTVGEPVQMGKIYEHTYWPSSVDHTRITFSLYKSSNKDVQFTSDAEFLAQVTIAVPSKGEGRSREMLAQTNFSGVLLQFKATAVDGGKPGIVQTSFQHL